MSKDRPIYIYILKDPRDNSVRYVGATANPERRLSGHFYNATGNERKREWIGELKQLNIRPIMEILEKVSQEYAREAELKYIAHYFIEEDCDLVNGKDVGFAQEIFGGDYYKDGVLIYRHQGRDMSLLFSLEEELLSRDTAFINIPQNTDGIFCGVFAIDYVYTTARLSYRARAKQITQIHSLGIEDVDAPLTEVFIKEPGGYKGGLALPYPHRNTIK